MQNYLRRSEEKTKRRKSRYETPAVQDQNYFDFSNQSFSQYEQSTLKAHPTDPTVCFDSRLGKSVLTDLFSLLRRHFSVMEQIKVQLIEIHEFNCEDLFRYIDQQREGYLTLSSLKRCLE